MRYLPMNKKGVSPIIATLLLIVIAVAAAVVTYAFVTGFIGTSSGSANQQGSFSFDTYTITDNTAPTNDTIVIYLRNTGTKALALQTAYVDGVVATVTSAPVTLPVSSGAVAVTITSPVELGAATGAHQLRMVCADGTPLQISVVKGA